MTPFYFNVVFEKITIAILHDLKDIALAFVTMLFVHKSRTKPEMRASRRCRETTHTSHFWKDFEIQSF